jgi:hypothetical protein
MNGLTTSLGWGTVSSVGTFAPPPAAEPDIAALLPAVEPATLVPPLTAELVPPIDAPPAPIGASPPLATPFLEGLLQPQALAMPSEKMAAKIE